MRANQRDPLVPINQEILRALLDERGLTIAALARRTGDLEQTLAHVVNTRGARCKKSRRAKIAKVLQGPQELLAGESFPIPVGFMLPDGFEFRYSPRTQLAASRFITRVRAALLRDMRTQSIDRKSNDPERLRLESEVLAAFSEFMMVAEWRKRFIEWNPGEQERRGYTEPATLKPWEEGTLRVTGREGKFILWEASPPRHERDPDHEAAILGVIRAMEHIFETWFTGAARLNYRSIRDFVHLPSHPFAGVHEASDSFSPVAILPPNTNRESNHTRSDRQNMSKEKSKRARSA